MSGIKIYNDFRRGRMYSVHLQSDLKLDLYDKNNLQNKLKIKILSAASILY